MTQFGVLPKKPSNCFMQGAMWREHGTQERGLCLHKEPSLSE